MFKQLTWGLIAAVFAVAPLYAFEWGKVDVHGFAGQGVLVSDQNNFFGHTMKGESHFTEGGLNATTWLNDRLKVGAQVYDFKTGSIGGLDRPQLDWAYLDYQWKDTMGFRVGKIKQPNGLYGEALDLEMARPFVLLPQSVYSAAWRDFEGSIWGGSVYGTQPLDTLGSLDYKLVVGKMGIRASSGIAQSIDEEGVLNIDRVNSKYAAMGQLIWNTPTPGWRWAGSLMYVDSLTMDGAFKSQGELEVEPPPASDLALLAPSLVGSHSQISIKDTLYSIVGTEYLWKNWTFGAEYRRTTSRYTITVENPAAAAAGGALTGADVQFYNIDGFYLSAAQRISKSLEWGTYYSWYYSDFHDRKGSGLAAQGDLAYHAFQKDWAVALRYDVTKNWIVKAEVHLMDGVAQVDSISRNLPWNNVDRYWTMGALKAIFYF